MLHVTFRNLLPSETLVGVANDMYLELRERAARSAEMRCYVTISADSAAAERPGWVRVQVELVHGEAKPLRVLAEGADAPLALRSSMLAALSARIAPDAVPKHFARTGDPRSEHARLEHLRRAPARTPRQIAGSPSVAPR